ncbi:MAG: penicillin-binding protein 2 [Patescibacteria group bacterium]
MDEFFKKIKISRGLEIEDAIMTVTEGERAIIETPFKKKGLKVIWYAIVVALIMLGARVFYLNVVKGVYYADLSKGNRIRNIIIKAPRGKIFDKFGSVLVRNVPSIDVIIVPSDLPESREQRESIAKNISQILGLNEEEVGGIIESQNEKSLNPILLKENITQDQVLMLAEKLKTLPGIFLDNTAIRNYENSLIFAPIIGYDGKITREELAASQGYLMTDYIGKTGLEKKYEKDLRGVHGAVQVEVDSTGNVKKNLGSVNPHAGQDLFLNIDEGLQKKLYDSLTSITDKAESKTAAAVAIDPRSGGVLALVSLPSYDNNLFARGISSQDYKNIIDDKNLPLLNRPINGEYPPGSTIKPAVAAAALAEGTITPQTLLSGNGGSINIGVFRFGDWKTHGTLDIKGAIAESCDVCFYAIGGGYGNVEGLGMDRMKKYENFFGFGSSTGIDLPGESSGLIPDEKWKENKIGEKWYIGDSYHAAIGQGFLTATPMQLANYTAAIANGGTLYLPRIVNRIKGSDGREKYISPEVIRKNFVSQDVLNVVREGMRQTVTDGSARSLEALPVAVAGKTGTAQFGVENKTHAWFISFAPYENPEIAMVILMEGGGEGSSSAVPVTKEVLQWYFTRDK